MKELKWYFNHGNFETFVVMYEDNEWLLVKNKNTGRYSFGLTKDFGTFCGFPVDQSCLSLDDAKETLQRFIDIDKRYIPVIPDIANQNIKRWQDMILRLVAE